MNIQQASNLLQKVREVNPLVHNITNVVVTNFTANGLLALGASPVMAYAKEEVADLAKIAGALVLNMGTLTEDEVEVMLIAARAANEAGVPVIFDPVGAGATRYRTSTARRIMSEVRVSILRGNAAEVANVIGEKWSIKGVDAGEGNGNVLELARSAAEKLQTTVVITGKIDIVTDGKTTLMIRNGHPILTKVTGTGCLLSSVIGAFAAVEQNHPVAAAAALTYYGVAAEIAAETAGDEGPGSFQIQLLNQLAKVSAEHIHKRGAVEEAAHS